MKINEHISDWLQICSQNGHSRQDSESSYQACLDYVNQQTAQDWWEQITIKIVRTIITAFLIWGFASIANWTTDPGQWKHWHREIASAICAVGMLIIFTMDKNEDHEPKKSNRR